MKRETNTPHADFLSQGGGDGQPARLSGLNPSYRFRRSPVAVPRRAFEALPAGGRERPKVLRLRPRKRGMLLVRRDSRAWPVTSRQRSSVTSRHCVARQVILISWL